MGIQLERNPLNTTYFMEDIVRNGVGGCCHDFAYALHDLTGWRMGAIWREYDDAYRNVPVHVFCITPNGQGIDIEGVRPVEEIRQLYSDPFCKERIFSAAAYSNKSEFLESLRDNDFAAFTYEPRDHRVADARKIILASPKFLELVESLKAAKAASIPAPKPF